MTLGRYLRWLFMLRFVAALLALTALLQLVDLMDRSDEILDRGLGWPGMLRFAVLRLPLVVPSVIPIAALASAVLTLAGLAYSSEVAAMRASGLALG
ncbi:MAG TPA: LptF/LptG family permease, partial [Candidatus Omnitrophota bacterium]|nr:LptF/LptG family permease [Candidatus Omnitrophota bacterium]